MYFIYLNGFEIRCIASLFRFNKIVFNAFASACDFIFYITCLDCFQGKKSKKQKERNFSDPPKEHRHKVQKDQKKKPHKHVEVYRPKSRVSNKEEEVVAVKKRKIQYDSEEDHYDASSDADDQPLSDDDYPSSREEDDDYPSSRGEDDDYPSSRGEDDDYPSSRGEDNDDFTLTYNESCPPSVTSKTVSEVTDGGINHYPSEDEKTKLITETSKKSKKHKTKVTVDKPATTSKSSERNKKISLENLPKKKPLQKSSKASSDVKPKLPSKSHSPEVKKPKDHRTTKSKLKKIAFFI